MTTASPLTIHTSKRKIWQRAVVAWVVALVCCVLAIIYHPLILVATVLLAATGIWVVVYRTKERIVVDHEQVSVYGSLGKVTRFPLATIGTAMLVHRFSYFTGRIVQTFMAVVFFDTSHHYLGFVWAAFYDKEDLRSLFMAFPESARMERKSGDLLTRP